MAGPSQSLCSQKLKEARPSSPLNASISHTNHPSTQWPWAPAETKVHAELELLHPACLQSGLVKRGKNVTETGSHIEWK